MTILRLLAAAVAAAGLAACAVIEPPPETHTYRVTVPPAAERFPRPPLAGTLEVAPLSAEGLVGDRAIVYVRADQPFEVSGYNYHLWNVAPGTLVQEELIRYLRAADAAPRVVSPALRLDPDYVIEGRITRFDQVFGDGASMVIEIELALIRSADNELLLLNRYRGAEPAADDSVPAAVLATERALAGIFARFLADLRGLKAAA